MAEIAKEVRNPYEKENTAQSIFNVIKSYSLNNLTQKSFYNDGLCRYRPLLLQDAQPVGYIAQLSHIAGPAVTH